jgi:tRNA (cytidine/uridine-2'-O-)-methyltransferase
MPMLHVALLEPEIAPNTGNIARLCAATGSRLHLIGRLGFHLDDRSLRRAGIDYWNQVDLVRHVDWAAFEKAMTGRPHAGRQSPQSQPGYSGRDRPL